MTKFPCRVCHCEVREEIENLLMQKVPMRQIAKQYRESFDTDDLHLLEQSIAGHRKHIKVQKELTLEEKDLLNRFEKGDVSLDEISRVIARRVFERMLHNPDDFRFIDFFRAELLRMKKEESEIKDAWAREIINRMFSGHLPPREITCEKCGHVQPTVKDSLVPNQKLSNGITNVSDDEIADGDLIQG